MKKAIIEASFGTSYTNALDNSVLALQKRFKEDFADYDVFTVITSGMVRSALAKKEIIFDDLDTMLERLKNEGSFTLHIISSFFLAVRLILVRVFLFDIFLELYVGQCLPCVPILIKYVFHPLL